MCFFGVVGWGGIWPGPWAGVGDGRVLASSDLPQHCAASETQGFWESIRCILFAAVVDLTPGWTPMPATAGRRLPPPLGGPAAGAGRRRARLTATPPWVGRHAPPSMAERRWASDGRLGVPHRCGHALSGLRWASGSGRRCSVGRSDGMKVGIGGRSFSPGARKRRVEMSSAHERVASPSPQLPLCASPVPTMFSRSLAFNACACNAGGSGGSFFGAARRGAIAHQSSHETHLHLNVSLLLVFVPTFAASSGSVLRGSRKQHDEAGHKRAGRQ